MSLFADYKKEREGKHVLENEKMFIVYSLHPQGQYLYIEDIYVAPEHRHQGLAREMGAYIEKLSKANKCKKIVISIVPNTEGATYNLSRSLMYGFRLRSSHENIIFLEKDV